MFECLTLKNGLRIVFDDIPFVRSVCLGVWVKNGSRNENDKNSGISHFIEHMLFKGTEKRSAAKIAEDMDAVGGQINAYTSKEYTCYYTRTLDSHFDIALDVLADMFFHSKFDQTEIDKEKKVVLEEISMYEDSPEDLVHDILHLNVWKNNPLGQSVLGTKESVCSFDTKTLKEYVKQNYLPQNTVIALAGNFDRRQALEGISKYFEHFQGSDRPEPSFTKIYHPCSCQKSKEIEQVHLCLGFPSVRLGCDQAYDVAVLNTILGGGMSSKLFQKIREEHGLAYSIYSHNSSFSDTGLFSIYAALNPSELDTVLNLIKAEIKSLFEVPLTQELLLKTKEQIKSNFLLSLENSSSRMSSIGKSLLMQNKVLTPDELIEKIDHVSLQSYEEIIHEIFDFDQMSLSMVGNFGGNTNL